MQALLLVAYVHAHILNFIKHWLFLILVVYLKSKNIDMML